jgi:hypothetical protein
MFNEKARQLWLEARTVGNLVKPAGGALFSCPELVDKGLHGSRRTIGTCESCEDQPRLLPKSSKLISLSDRCGLAGDRPAIFASEFKFQVIAGEHVRIDPLHPGQEAQSFSIGGARLMDAFTVGVKPMRAVAMS